jgi:hypothetical protein
MASAPFREPKKITDLAEFAGDYIEFMRATPQNSVCERLIDYAASFFTDVPVTTGQLQGLAVMVVDRIYRYAADLTIKDAATTAYFSEVTRYILDFLAGRDVRVFYILDNDIRRDRVDLAMELMFRAGVFVVSPYNVDGTTMDAADVRRPLDVELLAGRHVAYVEKDASVDHLRLVMELARDTDRLVIFRNVAPTSPEVQHIPSRGVPTSPW